MAAHPQYPGRATWSNWYNNLLDVRTGIAKHSSDGDDDDQIFSASRGVSFDVLPHDYTVIYGCSLQARPGPAIKDQYGGRGVPSIRTENRRVWVATTLAGRNGRDG